MRLFFKLQPKFKFFIFQIYKFNAIKNRTVDRQLEEKDDAIF